MVEVAVAFVIFALLAGSTLLIFSQLFGGQRSLDKNLDASLELEGLTERVRQWTKAKWPESVTTTGRISEGMLYEVEDLGLQVDPLDGKSTLELKRIRVVLKFRARTPAGGEEERSVTSVFLVGR